MWNAKKQACQWRQEYNAALRAAGLDPIQWRGPGLAASRDFTPEECAINQKVEDAFRRIRDEGSGVYLGHDMQPISGILPSLQGPQGHLRVMAAFFRCQQMQNDADAGKHAALKIHGGRLRFNLEDRQALHDLFDNGEAEGQAAAAVFTYILSRVEEAFPHLEPKYLKILLNDPEWIHKPHRDDWKFARLVIKLCGGEGCGIYFSPTGRDEDAVLVPCDGLVGLLGNAWVWSNERNAQEVGQDSFCPLLHWVSSPMNCLSVVVDFDLRS